jgi:pimeloyl-ACP methyl ester carboxylesterase
MIPIPKTTGYFHSFDGTRIYYETRGQGKPLVFVYGIACLINHWHPQITALSESYQTIICDFRGHHFSDVPENKKNLNMDSIAQDIICLCEHLNISKAFFLGHSYGNEIILKSFLKKPELFVGACFISSFFKSPFINIVSPQQTKEMFNYVRKLYNVAPSLVTMAWKFGVTNPLSVFLSAVTGGFNLEKTSRKDIEIYSQGVANIDVRVFVTLFEELMSDDSMDALQTFTPPALVIAGDKDALTPPSMQLTIHHCLPNSEFFSIPAGSHCVQLDFPGEVNAKIDSFLKSINY